MTSGTFTVVRAPTALQKQQQHTSSLFFFSLEGERTRNEGFWNAVKKSTIEFILSIFLSLYIVAEKLLRRQHQLGVVRVLNGRDLLEGTAQKMMRMVQKKGGEHWGIN